MHHAANIAYTEAGGLVLHATAAGPVLARLSACHTVTATTGPVPLVTVDADWSLTVDSWEQGSGDDPYTIAHRTLTREVTATDGVLPSWTTRAPGPMRSNSAATVVCRDFRGVG
jgi:hypothetical protein